MFDIEIMYMAEKLVARNCEFDILKSILFREGYNLTKNIDEALEFGISYADTWQLDNGWVICELI